ncbi:SOS response-associated peptidase [Chitinibacter tainanensis]|uniref:SOS response-associated peptidase n=1 Tax=Chitinibacter tainanensis TaxID=230667 RepID=UPI002354DDD4|nr:SOS response-associated peptidase family protein [Chitinibacter tainanensis]
MCVSFVPLPRAELAGHFHAEPPPDQWAAEVWQDDLAPIILPGDQARQAVLANYGFLPRQQQAPGARYSTLNARAETIDRLISYRQAWQQCQLCLVPMRGFYEPCYESGRAERYQIGLLDDAPFAVAGLWRSWRTPAGSTEYAFTQITINADQHPLMRRMHQPGEEKRSLVIIPATHYDAWLDCQVPQRARQWLQLYPADAMQARPLPKPPTPQLALPF